MNLNYTWLPASLPQVNNPLRIVKAYGSYLIGHNGEKIYDAISSWWCKPLGHCHSLVINSITEQLSYFEHHIPANAYNDIVEELSMRLVNIFSTMDKVMYASDGTSAIEIAMKLSYETRILHNQPQRNKFIALKGAYHGESIFTLSVCGISDYKVAYAKLLPDNYFIQDIPYVNSRFDPLWENCHFADELIDKFFARIAHKVTALIIEPIVQGAAGIKIISRDFLNKLIIMAKKHDLHVISDEIMVGLGRLGCYSVTKSILNQEIDLVCFAKNLTAGSIPMSTVIINQSITQLFKNKQRPFLHSHTHSGNALGAKVALNYLKHLENGAIFAQVKQAETNLLNLVNNLAKQFSFIYNPRAIGAIAALDLNINIATLNKLFSWAIKYEIYLRPIGNTLYIMPPLYNINNELEEIKQKLSLVLNKIST